MGVGALVIVEADRECEACACCETMRVHEGEGGLGPPELGLW